MINVAVALISIILGIAATALVGRYYFRRTTTRAITPFVHLHSWILSGIDPEVREHLKILFHDEPVEDITHLQLLVANTGSRAIRDCIRPLRLAFPKGVAVLDHSVIHRHPKELEVESERGEPDDQKREVVQVQFPLMNSNDFFLLKLLLKGSLMPTEVDCRITVDDVPPTLDLQWLPPSATEKEPKKVDWAAFWVGLGLLVFAACLVYVTFLLWHAQPSLFPLPWKTYEFSTVNALVLVMVVFGTLAVVLVGILMMTGIAFEQAFRRSRHRFPLPDGRQPSYRFRLQPDTTEQDITKSEGKETAANKAIDSDKK